MPLRSITPGTRADDPLGVSMPYSHWATVLTHTPIMATKIGWLIRVRCRMQRMSTEVKEHFFGRLGSLIIRHVVGHFENAAQLWQFNYKIVPMAFKRSLSLAWIIAPATCSTHHL
jgi:hypothetical protein